MGSTHRDAQKYYTFWQQRFPKLILELYKRDGALG